MNINNLRSRDLQYLKKIFKKTLYKFNYLTDLLKRNKKNVLIKIYF